MWKEFQQVLEKNASKTHLPTQALKKKAIMFHLCAVECKPHLHYTPRFTGMIQRYVISALSKRRECLNTSHNRAVVSTSGYREETNQMNCQSTFCRYVGRNILRLGSWLTTFSHYVDKKPYLGGIMFLSKQICSCKLGLYNLISRRGLGSSLPVKNWCNIYN